MKINYIHENPELIADVPGYEGKYAVTKDYQIYSYPNQLHKGVIKKPALTSDGYLRISTYINKKDSTTLIHRLIALTLVPNPDNKPEVNHKDGNKLNNHPDNLEWVTPKENTQHAWKNGLRVARTGENCPASRLTANQVINIWHCRGAVTGTELAKLYNITPSGVSNILNGRTWMHLNLGRSK